MPDHDGNVSNPYRPAKEWCCAGCVFGGKHEPWCEAEANRVNVLLNGLTPDEWAGHGTILRGVEGEG